MDTDSIHELDMFLEDIGFPIDKEGLLMESLDSPLPSHIKDAIALLPEGTYMTREEVRRGLIGASFEEEAEKKALSDESDEELGAKDEEEDDADIGRIEAEEGGSEQEE